MLLCNIGVRIVHKKQTRKGVYFMQKEIRRLSAGMKMEVSDMIMRMTKIDDGNYSAESASFIVNTLVVNRSKEDIEEILKVLDRMEVYGDDIYILWKNICNCSMKQFKDILIRFRTNEIKKSTIHAILEQFR